MNTSYFDELTFSFPEVDESAKLSMQFLIAGQTVPILASSDQHRLVGEGRFLIRLQPNDYPFALLITMAGKNAITGEQEYNISRNPQNYFISPPQGGIDGYYHRGQVRSFLASTDPEMNEFIMELKVFPMKRKAMDYFRFQKTLIPGPDPSALRGITLIHGGERDCEPIYEDICGFGSWDQEHVQSKTVYVLREHVVD